ncbi:hypothetical protein TNCV_277511 [Trichonephila clavipes]|uniref:Uncharacterized protein n=1 Tax=Trichonephila clavipes TaxID=2585209 RepID=A0A8X6VC62_TRICX|nr:hypothetical protein TNCV_277511 [Trichonephila clavipes]
MMNFAGLDLAFADQVALITTTWHLTCNPVARDKTLGNNNHLLTALATKSGRLNSFCRLNRDQTTRTTPEVAHPSPNDPTIPAGGFLASTDLTCISLSTWRVFRGSWARTHNTSATSS